MREGRERVDMEVVALAVPVIYSESTGPDSVIQTAEGLPVSPVVFSVTVQVKVREELPASSGSPVSDTTVFTVSGLDGTGEME